MIPYEQALSNSGKEKLPFNKKKPVEEPGSGRGSWRGPDQLEVRGKKRREKNFSGH